MQHAKNVRESVWHYIMSRNKENLSSASEPKKGILPFISVQHMLYAELYRTAYRYFKRAGISK